MENHSIDWFTEVRQDKLFDAMKSLSESQFKKTTVNWLKEDLEKCVGKTVDSWEYTGYSYVLKFTDGSSFSFAGRDEHWDVEAKFEEAEE